MKNTVCALAHQLLGVQTETFALRLAEHFPCRCAQTEAFTACAEIAQITLAMPDRHYLPANLHPFGLDSTGVSFVPVDEPHGQIEATFLRHDAH